MNPWRVRIFYPADPLGVVPGGIDTFIRGLIRHAPPELAFSLVGMTTDAEARPSGRWTRQTLGDRAFDFFPAVHVANAGQRGRVPLSVKFTAAVARQRAMLACDMDVFDFHRLEPSLLYASDPRPKNAFFHQDPAAVGTAGSDMLWRHFPYGYRRMEAALAPRLSSAWCVRDSGVLTLQQRYPSLAQAIRFVPTWVDTQVYSPADDATRERLRHESAAALDLPPDVPRIVSVGRLDSQKDPMLLLRSFGKLLERGERAVLLLVGDGVLRPALERSAAALGLQAHVRFLGLRSAPQVADVLRAADVFALSSAYEGMPMALLEALGCGVPVVTTDVGEIRRVVWPGVNGTIAAARTPAAFADALGDALKHRARYRRHTVPAVRRFQPARVLAPVYENYLSLVSRRAAPVDRSGERLISLVGAERRPVKLPPPPSPYAGRTREPVIGLPIDAISPAAACEIVMDWAEKRDSRTVCFCNVHSVVHGRRHPVHRAVIEQCDLATADGAPIAWTMSLKRRRYQRRTSGPDIMLQLCEAAEDRDIAIGLYGSTPATLQKLSAALRRRYPDLRIAYAHAPPFRPLTEEEEEAACVDINAAGVGLLFVALGCPKQEAWMAEHRGRVNAVMLGVGAAFDFHSGTVGRAPAWMRASGLEWLHRMVFSPKRLAARYAVTNTLFLIRSASELATAVGAQGLRAVPRASSKARSSDVSNPSSVRRPRAVNPTKTTMSTKLAAHHVEELVARIDAALPPSTGRMIEFISGGAREGTTTLASAYARALSEQRRVLLIKAKPGRSGGAPIPATIALAPSQPRRHADGYNVAALMPTGDAGSAYAASQPDAVWAALRASYDTIVLDMPPMSSSRAGLLVAPRCDGVVVVLEAEKTRAPVAEAMLASLRSVHANVLGTVLNKRRLHVPDALYRLL